MDPKKRKTSPSLSSAVERGYWVAFTRGVYGALILHVVFIGLFYQVGAPLLAIVNVGSVLAYLGILGLLRRHHNQLATALIWIEVIGHAALAVRMIGWDSGFHYYLLVFVPFIFVSSSRHISNRIFFAALICGVYMTLDLLMRSVDPVHSIGSTALGGLRYFNIATCFALLGYLSLVYRRTVSRAERKLRQLATTDALTGLLNRHRLVEIADYELQRRQRSQQPLSFILSDLDHFKAINDRFGHSIGDTVLSSVAGWLRKNLRTQDSVARWGGEEFLVLLPETSLEQAQLVAERVRVAISSEVIRCAEEDISLTMTFGAAEVRDGESLDSCIARADQAMYRGKRSGRNQIVLAAAGSYAAL